MNLLAIAAITEAATGLALLVVPSLVGSLLLGTQFSGVTIPVARLTGSALIALAIACWPGQTALCGMLTYSALATIFLASVAIRGNWVGPILWPAVVLHAVISILLGRTWLTPTKTGGQMPADSQQVKTPPK